MPEIVLEYVEGDGGIPLLLLSPVERERHQLAAANARAQAKALGWTDAMEHGEVPLLRPAYERILDAVLLEGEIANDDLIREARKESLQRVVLTCREPTAKDKLAVLTLRRRRLATEPDAADWSPTELRLLEGELCQEILEPKREDGEPLSSLPPRLSESVQAQCHALVFPHVAEERLFFTMKLRLASSEATI